MSLQTKLADTSLGFKDVLELQVREREKGISLIKLTLLER